ncbi:hypothetical protein PROFUN_07446 [Planoprotostelium fungivorum]|uniref:Uncharacterized protein n=1 Tax=Planoprotostelium fungivorum TaxID=1890364 RepID=A0A2P6NLJ1_9EUKA|nr:hypothetical protein PROFUN_07446 [Planoprotostelium fungivorum]
MFLERFRGSIICAQSAGFLETLIKNHAEGQHRLTFKAILLLSAHIGRSAATDMRASYTDSACVFQ